MRTTEGAALLADFNERVAACLGHLNAIAARAPAVVPA